MCLAQASSWRQSNFHTRCLCTQSTIAQRAPYFQTKSTRRINFISHKLPETWAFIYIYIYEIYIYIYGPTTPLLRIFICIYRTEAPNSRLLVSQLIPVNQPHQTHPHTTSPTCAVFFFWLTATASNNTPYICPSSPTHTHMSFGRPIYLLYTTFATVKTAMLSIVSIVWLRRRSALLLFPHSLRLPCRATEIPSQIPWCWMILCGAHYHRHPDPFLRWSITLITYQ